MKTIKLITALRDYLDECNKHNECHTFRGLIGFLNEKDIDIDYVTAQSIGLLEFNNSVSDLLE